MGFEACASPGYELHEEGKESFIENKDAVVKRADSVGNDKFSDLIYDYVKNREDDFDKGKCTSIDFPIKRLNDVLKKLSNGEVNEIFNKIDAGDKTLIEFVREAEYFIENKNEKQIRDEKIKMKNIREMEKKDKKSTQYDMYFFEDIGDLPKSMDVGGGLTLTRGDGGIDQLDSVNVYFGEYKGYKIIMKSMGDGNFNYDDFSGKIRITLNKGSDYDTYQLSITKGKNELLSHLDRLIKQITSYSSGKDVFE